MTIIEKEKLGKGPKKSCIHLKMSKISFDFDFDCDIFTSATSAIYVFSDNLLCILTNGFSEKLALRIVVVYV